MTVQHGDSMRGAPTDVVGLSAGASLGVVRVVPPEPALVAAGMPSAGGVLLGGERVQAIRQSVTTLGRDLRNAIVLLDPTVSRQHARILWDHGAWTIENCSRRNALWAGEREIGPGERANLQVGDQLRLGNTVLELLAPRQPGGGTAAVRHPTSNDGEVSAPSDALNDFELLDPGVTIRFALSGQFAQRARWVILGAGIALFLVSALFTLGTAALVGHQALIARGALSVLAALTIPLVPVLGAALLVGAIDRYEREPVVVLVGAFAWGALIAIPAALVLERWLSAAVPATGSFAALGNSAELAGHALLQGLSAAITEETVKGAGLLVLMFLLFDEFDNVTDGILYGVLIGAGFAMVENFVYFANSARADVGYLIVGRVILGWLSHSTFTALFGAGLGFIRETRDRRVQVLAPLLGFGAAIALHTLFDSVDFAATAAVHAPHASTSTAVFAVLAVILDYVPLFAAQAVLLRLVIHALRREADIVREYLAPEVFASVVTPDEYAILQQASARARIEHGYLLGWGPRTYLTARALHQTATGLAFRKWHVAMGAHPKMTARQPEELYRERLGQLRRALALRVLRHPPQMGAPPTQPALPWTAPIDDEPSAQ